MSTIALDCCADEIMQIKTVLVLRPSSAWEGRCQELLLAFSRTNGTWLLVLLLMVKVMISLVTNVTESDPPLSFSQVVCGDT